MSEDLDRAVDARIDAFRPDRTPPFSALEDRHRRRSRRHKHMLAGASVAAVLLAAPAVWVAAGGGDSLLQQADTEPPRVDRATGPTGPTGDAPGLAVVGPESSGMVNQAQVEPGAVSSELVTLPGFLLNNGPEPVVVLRMQVIGTDLRAEMPPVLLGAGDRLPLAFRRVVDCSLAGARPDQLDLAVGLDDESSVVVPMPVAALDRASHACTEARRAANTAAAMNRGQEATEGLSAPPVRLEGSTPPPFTDRLAEILRSTVPPGLSAGDLTGQFMRISNTDGGVVGDVTAYEGRDGASEEELATQGFEIQGEAQGWPAGVSVAVLDRRPSYYQILLQTPTAYFNYTIADSTALADVENWAREVAKRR